MCERVTGPQADKGASRLCKAGALQAGNASTTTPCSLARTRLTGTSGASSAERGHQNVRPLASPVSYNRNRANWFRQMTIPGQFTTVAERFSSSYPARRLLTGANSERSIRRIGSASRCTPAVGLQSFCHASAMCRLQQLIGRSPAFYPVTHRAIARLALVPHAQ